MTDQQPHTPDTDLMRQWHVLADHSGDKSTEEYEAQFDRWLATVEAAAEQRGAVKALQEAKKWLQNGGWIELNQRITPNGTSDSMAQITVIWLGEEIERHRADRIANKEGGE